MLGSLGAGAGAGAGQLLRESKTPIALTDAGQVAIAHSGLEDT